MLMSQIQEFCFFERHKTYTILSCSISALYFALFLMLLFFPHYFLDAAGMAKSESTSFLSRRAAMLMLGFSVLAFHARKAPDSTARQAIALSIWVSMGAMAVLGFVEYWRGFASSAILQPVAIESLSAVAYFLLWFVCRKSLPVNGD
jgi:hypothetical protein